MKMDIKVCRACDSRPALIGVYCVQCMRSIREFQKREKEALKYRQAIEYGSGDLWKSNQ